MAITYLNGKYRPLTKAKISLFDRGFLYGDGVFDTMRSYRGIPFRLDDHLRRTQNSIKRFHINADVDPKKMKTVIYNLLKYNKLKNAYIKIIVTRGVSKGLLMPSGKCCPTVIVLTLPYAPYPEKRYEKGCKLAFSANRIFRGSIRRGHKTLNYLENVMWRMEAKRRGVDDMVILNEEGHVAETSSSNIFLIRGKRMATPGLISGCLAGIARKTVIEQSRIIMGNKASERPVKKKELLRAGEVFLTNSLAEIVPVVKIENTVIGDGKPGFLTKKFMEAYRGET